MIVVQLKMTMCDQEGLLLQLTYVNYETLDTILMIIKIPEKVDEGMVSKFLKNNVKIIIQTQRTGEVQFVKQRLVMHEIEKTRTIVMINELFEIQAKGCIKMTLTIQHNE